MLPHPATNPITLGQESVWTFPRPSIAQAVEHHLRVVFDGRVLAETRAGVRTIETSHPPTFYFPAGDVDLTMLEEAGGGSVCEWKGRARYWDVVSGGRRVAGAAWSYPRPTATFAIVRDHIAFYPGLMEACFVDGERAEPQAGRFYGGWITSGLAGPFKGPAGTEWW